jgi:hypothetical protein
MRGGNACIVEAWSPGYKRLARLLPSAGHCVPITGTPKKKSPGVLKTEG